MTYEYSVTFKHCTTDSVFTVDVFAQDDDVALEKARRRMRAHMSYATLPNWVWYRTEAIS
jgi:hypothetical protein